MRRLFIMPKMDKRVGRRTVRERYVDTREVVLPSYSFEDAVELFLNVKKANNLKKRTLDGYKVNLRYFSDWMLNDHGNLTIDRITIHILREYVLWCANEKPYYQDHPYKAEWDKDRRGLSPASVNVRIRVLKTFFATLHQEGIIVSNPSDNLSLMKVEEDTVQPLTDDEIKRLLAAPNQKYFGQFRDYVIIILMIDTGMRLNEACSLEVKDIDFRSRQIILPASKNKNRKTRILPLSAETVKLLMQLISETKEHFDSTYVFTTNYGEAINEKTIQKSFYKYAEKAGIKKRVSPHVLRHNFAKMAALNGMDIFTLMRILGHSDISTTRKYVQINDEDVRQQHMQFSPLQRVIKRR
jgi:integrase/recombinase XerD